MASGQVALISVCQRVVVVVADDPPLHPLSQRVLGVGRIDLGKEGMAGRRVEVAMETGSLLLPDIICCCAVLS